MSRARETNRNFLSAGITATWIGTVLLAGCENPQPPGMCGAIAEQTVVVGETATVSACFDDPNDDMLSYGVTTSDPGVATVRASGSTMTVSAVAPGTAFMTVTATDVTGLTGNQQFRVIVPNRAPVVLGAIDARELSVGESAELDVSSHFAEPDGQELSFAFSVSDESVVSFSADGPVVTIAAQAKGTATVTVTATDPGGLSATQSFQATVPNRAPAAQGSMPEQTVEVGGTAAMDVTDYFSDPDGDALTYMAASSDAAVVVVSISGGDLTVESIAKGRAAVTVTATDTEGLAATQEFAVTAPNQPPVTHGLIAARTIEVDETGDLDLSSYFSDPDGDALVFTATVSDAAIIGASVDGAALTVGAIAKGEATVTVTATDTEGLTARQEFVVTVPNRPPFAAGSIDERTVEVDETAELDLSPYFSDPDGDALTFAATVSDAAIIGTSVDGSALTVGASAKGAATVTVTATDTEGLTAIQAFVVTVPNRPPLGVGSIDERTLEVGRSATLEVSGYFEDPDGDVLAYAVISSDAALIGASVEGAAVTVEALAKGGVVVTVTATDTEGLAAMQEFAVTAPNQPPVAAGSIDARTLEVDETADLDLPAYFSDPDGDALVFSATVSDAAVIGASVDGAALTVGAVAKGEATVTVTATDTEGLASTQEFVVTVPNRPPFAAGAFEARTVEVGGTADLNLPNHFSDPDGDALTFAATVSDAAIIGASVDGGALTVSAVAKGEATVTVTVTDTEGLTATQAFAVTVPNRPPLAVGSIDQRTMEIGGSATLELPGYFEDPDGDALDYAVTSSDATLIGASVEGAVLTVEAMAKGGAVVTVTATDTEGLAATQEFAVSVANRPPHAVGSIAAQTVAVGETAAMELPGYFEDPDGDALVYAATVPEGSVIELAISGTAVTITALRKGEAAVTVTVV